MNMRKVTAALLLAALLPVAALAADEPGAQEREAARREMERARAEVERARGELERATRALAKSMARADRDNPKAQYFEYITDPRRAVLGIIIDDEPKDAAGVRVLAITPGGGAEKAGLKAGDILVSMNGQSLAAEKGQVPAHKLRDELRKLKAGDNAKVEYERAGKRAAATIVTSPPDPKVAWSMPPGPLLNLGDLEDLEHVMPLMPMVHFRGSSVRGLELARLDDDLSWYFKTKDGVLVLKAPKGGALTLKSGDVIQKIDGEPVSEPITVLDKLHGRFQERTVRLEVQRQGKKVEIEGKLPAGNAPEVRKRVEVIVDEQDPDDDE